MPQTCKIFHNLAVFQRKFSKILLSRTQNTPTSPIEDFGILVGFCDKNFGIFVGFYKKHLRNSGKGTTFAHVIML